ncbi:hypothetical protein PM082_011951 [Marasmius tenuissimus]|nr:hypothetical protein PM082_011951 [Marasmius tenuissimus]
MQRNVRPLPVPPLSPPQHQVASHPLSLPYEPSSSEFITAMNNSEITNRSRGMPEEPGRMDTHNTNTGPGTQNNNNAVNQTIAGRDQISGEVINVGRVLVKNFTTSVSNRRYKTLWDSVAGVAASHTAKQQCSRGACLEGTRVTALKSLEGWRNDKKGCPICWLSGAAGVGKSAIAMTVARLCEEEGLLACSFFFFRSDPNRNNPSALALSIAHGLVSTIPFMRSPIERRISKDPRILEAELEDQFRELILKPTFERRWLRLFFELLLGQKVPSIVIIDGLDECGDEETQLRILSTIRSAAQRSRFPLRFMICSRPESWFRQAFAADPLRELTRWIALDESNADQDILTYLLHEFKEISTSAKYSHVQFPSPWPSSEDLQSLTDRASGQFVYVVTAVKFVKLEYSHPITQLHFILQNTPNPQRSASPYHDLNALYHVILSANPHQEEVHSILIAILVLPPRVACPACIELLLGRPSGEVSLTLRAMYSVLDMGGRGDRIRLYHNSFREFLVDQDRSRNFHIDIEAQTPMIARKWLQNLTASRLRTCSVEQLYSKETRVFFTEWIDFCCRSCPRPSWDLLNDLKNVDLSSVFFCRHVLHRKSGLQYPVEGDSGMVLTMKQTIAGFLTTSLSYHADWSQTFRGLHQWMEKYFDNDSHTHPNEYMGDTTKDHNSELTHRNTDEVDLVKSLKRKFSERPRCFHLELSPEVPLQHDFVSWAVHVATGCTWWTRLHFSKSEPGNSLPDHALLRLTDCHCDLRGGKEPGDPAHLAFQEVCMEVVKVCISDFEFINNLKYSVLQLRAFGIFTTFLASSLLQHCRLGTELFSLCQSFLELAKDYPQMTVPSEWGEKQRKQVLGWIKTLPKSFAKEAKALEAQIIGLPWQEWADRVPYNGWPGRAYRR